ncbi:MAG TPA: hypothetical protein VFS40_08445 [Gemmatimonadales bacterium]|nr:hypothetical protein [Gemmatimonadales bacterium]
MTRFISLLVLCGSALVHAPAARAQERSPHAWRVGLVADFPTFRGASRDTLEAEATSVRPGQALALGVSVARVWAAWDATLDVSYLPSHVEAESPELLVRARSATLERLRLAPLLGRRLTGLSTGGLWLQAGPTLDFWSLDGSEDRTVVGAQGRLALRLPMGRFELENVVAYQWSPGPFRAGELPPGYARRALRAVAVGANLRLGL